MISSTTLKEDVVKFWIPVLLLVGMTWLGGCGSSISVNHDYDTMTDFSQYTTFDWASRASSQSNLDATGAPDGLLDQRIRNAVNQALPNRGLTRDEDNPDLLVVYHLGVQDKVQVTDWGYSYGRSYYGMGARDIDVYQYQQGTLIIDLVDSQAKTLVWRGSGTKTLGSSNISPEQQQKNINEAVGKILSQFPPGR
jgi:hypothetical protein